MEKSWPVVAQSKNLLAQGLLGSKIYWPGLDPALILAAVHLHQWPGIVAISGQEKNFFIEMVGKYWRKTAELIFQHNLKHIAIYL